MCKMHLITRKRQAPIGEKYKNTLFMLMLIAYTDGSASNAEIRAGFGAGNRDG
jgi:hypothetical protein